MIYDEFNRSPPEANNVLLSILEERLVDLPSHALCESQIKVHPKFAAIFTSNPLEYAGVHKTQDALLDRMITIHVEGCDATTEAEIVSKKSGLSPDESDAVVRIVREARAKLLNHPGPTLRASLMVARVTSMREAAIRPDDAVFFETCRDVLRLDTLPPESAVKAVKRLHEIIAKAAEEEAAA